MNSSLKARLVIRYNHLILKLLTIYSETLGWRYVVEETAWEFRFQCYFILVLQEYFNNENFNFLAIYEEEKKI